MTAQHKILPVILAGGGGIRLWPLSREDVPKQFQPLTGPLSTFQLALQRVRHDGLFHPPLVITADRHRYLARRQAADAGVPATIVAEPARRDSAAAVAVAALLAERQGPGGLVLAVAADHLIADIPAFHAAAQQGLAAAEQHGIVVFGIAPQRPETAYGYIKPGPAISPNVYRVDSFVEKPDAATAQRYVDQGFLWNSGNFLFRSDAMIAALAVHARPVLAAARDAIAAASTNDSIVSLQTESFCRSPRISIDYAVIEKVRNAAVVRASFGWTDIGNWTALAAVLPHDGAGNAIVGRTHLRHVRNSMVHSAGPLTVAVGLDGVVVVSTRDAVLVMPKSREGEVKAMVDELAATRAAEAVSHDRRDQAWGHDETLARSDGLHLGQRIIEAGMSCRFAGDDGRRWLVVSGTGTADGASGREVLRAGEPITVPNGGLTVSAGPSGPLRLLAIGLPGASP